MCVSKKSGVLSKLNFKKVFDINWCYFFNSLQKIWFFQHGLNGHRNCCGGGRVNVFNYWF
jgi:hypothetical protein